jgi:hypothetical protein
MRRMIKVVKQTVNLPSPDMGGSIPSRRTNFSMKGWPSLFATRTEPRQSVQRVHRHEIIERGTRSSNLAGRRYSYVANGVGDAGSSPAREPPFDAQQQRADTINQKGDQQWSVFVRSVP